MSELAQSRPRAAAPAPAPGPAAWRRHLAQLLVGGRGSLAIPLVGAVVLVLFPTLSGHDEYWISQLSYIAIYAMVVSGLNLSFGYAGEVQFSQIFMFALGAYVTAILAQHGVTTEIVLLFLIGGIVAAAIGALIALPALRVGGWSLAMVSFFLVLTIPNWVTIFHGLTGGSTGLLGFPGATWFGSVKFGGDLYEFIVVGAIAWFVVYRNFVTSRYGTIFLTLRESPTLATSLGFSVPRLKLQAYAMGAFPAGMAGCMFGFLSQVLTPTTFGLTLGIGIVAASVLGGVTSVYGAIVGAAILQLGPQSSLSFQEYAPIAYGVFLIVIAIVFRRGLGGLGKLIAQRASESLVGRRHSAAIMASGSLSAGDAVVGERREPLHAEVEAHELAGTALRVEGVSKAFGGVQALKDVTLSAAAGEVTALIGSNGSGKTTMLNVISGYVTPDSGAVELGDRTLTDLAPFQVARAGVGRTFQTPSIPTGVSVLDVVATGRFSTDPRGIASSVLRLPSYRRSRRADRDEALAALERVGLADVADAEAGTLALGTRRLVEVARSLCADPRLLLLDEPASGLGSAELETLGRVVTEAAAAGATVVLIEHNFRFIVDISTTVHVLHLGELIATGRAEEIGDDERVIESYLGSAVTG
jgi:branched-chain amino acid transport system permease protein